MIRRLLFAAAVFGVALLASGCAVTDVQQQLGTSVSTPRAEDPARIGLPQPYRVFYDELKDEGDWTLIEPYGYVFRPRVNFVAWRPYQDGWWEPSDYYGWIWNTYEPFGWITYHYGSWFYDEFQGWVWQPGSVWGPAWVAWVDTGDYLGWAPLAPAAYNAFDKIPDGVFSYAPVGQFAARTVGQQSVFVSHLPQVASGFHEIVNVGHVNGIAFNKGPDPVEMQRRGGTVGQRFDDATLPRVKIAAVTTRTNEAELQTRTVHMVTAGREELRRMVQSGIAPPSSGDAQRSIVPPPAPRSKPPVAPDSTRAHRKPHPLPRKPADSTRHGNKPAAPDSSARIDKANAPRHTEGEAGAAPDTSRNH